MRAHIRPRDLIAIGAIGAFGLFGSGVHVVKSGETLAKIAVDHGTSVRQLVSENGLANPNLILVGQKLVIPGTTAAPAPTTYVVKSGDSLSTIAKAHGTTVKALADANGISNVNIIRVGQKLAVAPGAAGAPAPSSSGGTPSTSSSPQRRGERHSVRSGDTVAGIARNYGISAAEFSEWNGIVNGIIYATTRLLLWDPGDLPTNGGAAGTYTVRNGDTLGGIAARHGVSASTIAKTNGIADPNRIRIGQKLDIPGATGSIRCPVPGASFINDWGFPRSGGRSHAGNDLFAARGTNVVAPVSGWVDFATGSIGGKQFRLTQPDGTQWFGSHMDSFGKSGQVSAGDVIGSVGDSGNAKGGRPHLHFEIHPQGNDAVNPYPLMRGLC